MKARFEKIQLRSGNSFAVIEHDLPAFDTTWHFHPEIELTLITRSSGRRIVGNSLESFTAGDLVLLGPNLPHFWQNDGPPRVGRSGAIVIQFNRDTWSRQFWTTAELTAIDRLLQRSARGLVFSGPSARSAATRIRNLPPLRGLPAFLELLAILDLLSRGRSRPLCPDHYDPQLDRRAEARLGRAIAFLSVHYREPVTLPEVARCGAMAPAAFSRYFKRVTGTNVMAFLNDLRVERACRQLRETSSGIGTIAFESGFTTLSSFNRRFRERMQCSPRNYRQMLKPPSDAH